jgi:hypothetical protein
MKKILLMPALCMVLLSACKKDNEQSKTTEPPVVKYPVSFNLSGFSQIVTTIATADKNHQILALTPTDSLKQATTNLTYVVFDSDGNQVNRLSQLTSVPANTYKLISSGAKLISTNGVYGQIVDSLAVGAYTVVLIGANKQISLNTPDDAKSTVGANQYFPTMPLSTSAIYFPSNDKPGDLFYYKGTINVTAGNNSAKKATLNRIVGQLTLNIEDPIPPSAAYVELTVVDNTGYKISSNSPNGAPISHIYGTPFTASDKGKSNFSYTLYVLNTATPFAVQIRIYDAQDNILVSKNINSISVKANQKTTLTGKIFGASSSLSTGISSEWGLTGTTIKF